VTMPTVRIQKVSDRQEIGRILVIEDATNNDTFGVFRDPTGWGTLKTTSLVNGLWEMI